MSHIVIKKFTPPNTWKIYDKQHNLEYTLTLECDQHDPKVYALLDTLARAAAPGELGAATTAAVAAQFNHVHNLLDSVKKVQGDFHHTMRWLLAYATNSVHTTDLEEMKESLRLQLHAQADARRQAEEHPTVVVNDPNVDHEELRSNFEKSLS